MNNQSQRGHSHVSNIRRIVPIIKKIKSEYKYRIAMEVKEITIYQYNHSFAICPRCHIPMEREYQSFCDRCGQKLLWKQYDEGKIKIRRNNGLKF